MITFSCEPTTITDPWFNSRWVTSSETEGNCCQTAPKNTDRSIARIAEADFDRSRLCSALISAFGCKPVPGCNAGLCRFICGTLAIHLSLDLTAGKVTRMMNTRHAFRLIVKYLVALCKYEQILIYQRILGQGCTYSARITKTQYPLKQVSWKGMNSRLLFPAVVPKISGGSIQYIRWGQLFSQW